MNESHWVWASQLASGTVLWDEYTQASGVVRDFHTLLPLSVAMRRDVAPWMDWLSHRPDIVQAMELQFYKPMPELMATAMLSWMNEWETRLEHGEKQFRMFLQEWEHVLTTPGFSFYRQSQGAASQLERLACRVLMSDRHHVEQARGEWVRSTLCFAPHGKCGELAYNSWNEMHQDQREQLQPEWAQWHGLFPDREAFLGMVLRGNASKDTAISLELPPDLGI